MKGCSKWASLELTNANLSVSEALIRSMTELRAAARRWRSSYLTWTEQPVADWPTGKLKPLSRKNFAARSFHSLGVPNRHHHTHILSPTFSPSSKALWLLTGKEPPIWERSKVMIVNIQPSFPVIKAGNYPLLWNIKTRDRDLCAYRTHTPISFHFILNSPLRWAQWLLSSVIQIIIKK